MQRTLCKVQSTREILMSETKRRRAALLVLRSDGQDFAWPGRLRAPQSATQRLASGGRSPIKREIKRRGQRRTRFMAIADERAMGCSGTEGNQERISRSFSLRVAMRCLSDVKLTEDVPRDLKEGKAGAGRGGDAQSLRTCQLSALLPFRLIIFCAVIKRGRASLAVQRHSSADRLRHSH